MNESDVLLSMAEVAVDSVWPPKRDHLFRVDFLTTSSCYTAVLRRRIRGESRVSIQDWEPLERSSERYWSLVRSSFWRSRFVRTIAT